LENNPMLDYQPDNNVPAPDKGKHHRAYELVSRKRASEEPLQPGEVLVENHIGSKGWNTRGYLPHYDKPGTIQMLTFRLADAMPAVRRHEWEVLLQIENQREQHTKLEAYLDRGYGQCLLNNPEVASAVASVLLKFDGERYRICAWVIMPNHVHVLVELWTMPLGSLMKAWKGTSARSINELVGRGGQVWQHDYWDRFIRDEIHFGKAQRYIESNPVKAGLVTTSNLWSWSSANLKWRWIGPSRFHGGHLASANWERGVGEPPPWVVLDTQNKAE
jgi:putative DNA methylase